MNRYSLPSLVGASIISLFLFTSCSSNQSPEDIAAAFIKTVEDSFEEHNGRKLRSLISENYLDDNNRTKKDVAATASAYLLQNKTIHILTKVTAVNTDTSNTVSATVLSALAGTPIVDISSIAGLNADIYWFDITLSKEDSEWRLISASWRKAMVDDFFR